MALLTTNKRILLQIICILGSIFCVSSCSLYCHSSGALEKIKENTQQQRAFQASAATDVPKRPPMQPVDVIFSHKPKSMRLPDIEPPVGFVWKCFDGSAVLQPSGWFAHSNQENMGGINYYTYAASPVDFSMAKPFRTGLTVQVLRDEDQLYDIAADDLAALYLAPYLQSIENGQAETMVFEKGEQENYKTILIRYKTIPLGDRPEVVVHKYSVADMRNNMVYVFTFESPAENWQDAWEIYGNIFFANIKMETAFYKK